MRAVTGWDRDLKDGFGSGLVVASGGAELDHLPCMALIECSGEVVAANRLYRDLSGDKSYRGASIDALLVGAFPPVAPKRQRFDCLMVRQNGRPMVVNGSAQPVVHHGRRGRLVLLMERADGAASDDGGQSTLFESVLNSLPEASAITFANRIVHINHEFTALFGYQAHHCIGLDLNELTVPVSRRVEVLSIADAVQQKGRASLETVRQTQSGEEVDVAVQVVPLPLGGGISGHIVTFRDIRAQKLADARLQHSAMHDALTGLANRSLFLNRLRHAMARLDRRSDRMFSIMFIDLDGFKQANDGYGHAAGDAVLVEIAQRMESCLRPEDTVARFGGDEFALLLDDAVLPRDIVVVAERIQAEVCRPMKVAQNEIQVTASIGIVSAASRYHSAEEMLRDADAAMYQAKALGRRRYVLFEDFEMGHLGKDGHQRAWG